MCFQTSLIFFEKSTKFAKDCCKVYHVMAIGYSLRSLKEALYVSRFLAVGITLTGWLIRLRCRTIVVAA